MVGRFGTLGAGPNRRSYPKNQRFDRVRDEKVSRFAGKFSVR